jgi:VacB/RNase II family 3'-5' exoribonuclease
MTRTDAHRIDMVQLARQVLHDHGFEPDLPPGIVESIAQTDPVGNVRDLRGLAWSSIDNDDSRDLDQIEVAEPLPGGSIRILVGIADVDALVPKDSEVDRFAKLNTVTLYTGVHTFAMLPPVLSTDRTSLLEGVDRLAVITEIVVGLDGELDDAQTRIYPARVASKAKLVYERVGAWLEGHGSPPPNAEIAAQLELQDEAAQRLRKLRHAHGALDLATTEAHAVVKGDTVVDLEIQDHNRARQLIEDIMVAVNGATARYLEARKRSSIRRVVVKPKRWDRIVELAAGLGTKLPAEPSAPALSDFVAARRTADPARFADLSLSIVKLLGPGMYVLQRANEPDVGHFGLAVQDYQHSTAPNRRYPDLIAQRLLKAAANDEPPPYSDDELLALAAHCTQREDAARKVERTMRKIAAAIMLSPRIGQTFDAVVTGASDKGTFVRLLRPPAEGLVVRNQQGLDVGDAVKVRLVSTEPTRGFVDIEAIR